MEQVQEDRFVFKTEWFDKQADLIREYNLTYYPRDGSIDMVSEVYCYNWTIKSISNTSFLVFMDHFLIFAFLCIYSLTWKTGGSSWKEWPIQASVKTNFSLAQLLPSMQDSSSWPTMLTLPHVRPSHVARRLSSLWSSLMPTCTLERLSSPSTKTVSLSPNWRWADLLPRQQIASLAQQVEQLPSTWQAMFVLVWRSLPMVQSRDGMTFADQRTQFRLRSMHLQLWELPMVPIALRTLCMEVPTTDRRLQRWECGSRESARQAPCSAMLPALWSSPTLFNRASPDRSLTQSWPRALRSLLCRCSTWTDPQLRSSSKFIKVYFLSSHRWLSKWPLVPASLWRSGKRTLWRLSVTWLAPWTPRLQRI